MNLGTTLSNFGFLRIALITLSVFLALIAPVAHMETVLEWPLIVPTLIGPAVTPLFAMVLLLDTLMARIFLSSTTSQQHRQKYKRIILVNLVVVTVVIVAWFDFFSSLGSL